MRYVLATSLILFMVSCQLDETLWFIDPDPQYRDPSDTAAGSGSEPATCDDTTLSQSVFDLFSAYCYDCHGSGGQYSGANFDITDLASLDDEVHVVPYAPEESLVYTAVRDGWMPDEPRADLTADQIALVKEWIACGAEPYEASARPFISPSDELQAMLDELDANVSASDQPYVRYLSLVHLYNAGILGASLATYADGLAKTTLSLTYNIPDPLTPTVVALPEEVAQTVDPDILASGLIFRIDLNELDWDVGVDLPRSSAGTSRQVDAWEALLKDYPYGVYYSSGYPGVGSSAERLRELTGSRLPYVNGDWFAAAATQPPIYDQILHLPDTLDEFFAQMGVAVSRVGGSESDPLGPLNSADCAGFSESGVSVHNRVICRIARTAENPALYEDLTLGSGAGYCWTSFDFKSDVDTANIFAHPLDFNEDGGESICSLDNGQQIYYINNAVGEYLERAPVQVVDDPYQDPDANGDTVTNGVSCMRCHSEGIKQKADQIREAVLTSSGSYYDSVRSGVLNTYTENTLLSDVYTDDQALFQGAIDLIGISVSDPEPISSLVSAFELKMDLERVAAELGLESDELSRILENDADLAGQVPQLLTGGKIDRDVFDAELAQAILCSYDDSLCYSSSTSGCGASSLPCWGSQTCVAWGEFTGACASPD